MLSPDLDLRDIDARHWTNWWKLLVPPRVLARDARWALVVVDGETPIKVIVRGEGSIDPKRVRGAIDPAAWAKQLDVAAVVVVERSIIAELSAKIENALALDQDYAEQGLIALRALKKRAGKGLWSEPSILELLPTPSYDGLQRTFDLLISDRTALLAYVIDDDRRRVHASIIAVKQDGDISIAATHRAIADLMPEAAFAASWETQHKRVLQAVEERFARPAVGVFLERATVQRVLTGPSDQLSRELNAKRVVIDPAPAWLLGLMGGATVAAMAGRAASALARMLPQSARERASNLAHRAGTAIKESGPFAQLGFDPLELWSRLRHFYRE